MALLHANVEIPSPARSACSPMTAEPLREPSPPSPPPGPAAAAASPVMAQYHEIKRAHPGCLLFFRMGDFYELFFEDAVAAPPALDIPLTNPPPPSPPPIPLPPVPLHP